MKDLKDNARRIGRDAQQTARAVVRKARDEGRTLVEDVPAAASAGRRPGRKRDAEATRRAILEAAKAAFGRAGYDQVSLRDIAARANADVALIARYFGSKEELFAAALSDGKPAQPPPYTGARSEFGTWIARRILSQRETDPTPQLLALHHSVGNPHAAAVVRKMVTERFIHPLGAFLGGDDGELRASLIYAQLAGLAMMGRLLKLEPIADADREALIALVGRAIQAHVDGTGTAR